jgi:hypothetical protein
MNEIIKKEVVSCLGRNDKKQLVLLNSIKVSRPQ